MHQKWHVQEVRKFLNLSSEHPWKETLEELFKQNAQAHEIESHNTKIL